MPDEQGFIAAIAEAPDDDALRLIFADLLEEKGDAVRAEFIRVQCELARLEPADARYPELHVRQLEMLAERERDWLGEWSERLVRWEFRRGLLHAVTITPEPFVAHGSDLVRRHPVERVAFVNEEGESLPADDVRRVVAVPALSTVRALEVAGCRPGEPMLSMFGGEVQTNTWLSALADARHVTRLQELLLTGGTRSGREPINLEAWQHFCQVSHLRTLRHLDLSDRYATDGFDVPDQVVTALARSPLADDLRSLSLSGCYVSDTGAHQIAGASRFRNLEELDLSSCDLIRREGLRALVESPSLVRLTSLGVAYGLDLSVLASAPVVSRLRSLHLAGDASRGMSVGIGQRMESLGRHVLPNEWESLSLSPHLGNLTRLSITAYTTIPAEAIAVLLGTPWAGKLQELKLHYRQATPDCFRAFFSPSAAGPTPLCKLSLPPTVGIGKILSCWPGLAGIAELSFPRQADENTRDLLGSPFLSCRLSRLDLSESCEGLNEVQTLAGCSALKGLRWLGFGYNDLTPEKMTILLTSPHLRHLEALHLSSEYDREGTSEAALGLLAESEGFPRLRDVVVGSGTPAGAIEALRKRFGPRLRVWCDY